MVLATPCRHPQLCLLAKRTNFNSLIPFAALNAISLSAHTRLPVDHRLGRLAICEAAVAGYEGGTFSSFEWLLSLILALRPIFVRPWPPLRPARGFASCKRRLPETVLPSAARSRLAARRPSSEQRAFAQPAAMRRTQRTGRF